MAERGERDSADRGQRPIKVVSHSVHARRARLYLQHQRPDLARRMVRAADYRPGEWVLLKPFFAGYELLKIAKTRRTLDTDRGRQARSRCPLTRDGGGPGGHEIQ